MCERNNYAWVAHVGTGTKAHFVGASDWAKQHLVSLGVAESLLVDGNYMLALISCAPRYVPVSQTQPVLETVLPVIEDVYDPHEYADDCGGDVAAAELRIYQRTQDYLKRSNMNTLFKLMNKSGNGALTFEEWK